MDQQLHPHLLRIRPPKSPRTLPHPDPRPRIPVPGRLRDRSPNKESPEHPDSLLGHQGEDGNELDRLVPQGSARVEQLAQQARPLLGDRGKKPQNLPQI